ncbi:MAG: hypothetical protein ACRDMV_03175 [Streptosporangiales bacterium]
MPQLGDLTIGPRWTERMELLEDLAVFTRLTLAQETSVFLLGGCLTLGVLGAAKCFLHGARGAHNARQVTDLVGNRDFVLVAEARRVGGIADTPDLTMAEPLLLLARDDGYSFSVVHDSSWATADTSVWTGSPRRRCRRNRPTKRRPSETSANGPRVPCGG